MPYPLPSGGLGGGRGNFTLKLASQSECPFVRRRAAKTAIDDRMGLSPLCARSSMVILVLRRGVGARPLARSNLTTPKHLRGRALGFCAPIREIGV
jgi:hypothetical protein